MFIFKEFIWHIVAVLIVVVGIAALALMPKRSTGCQSVSPAESKAQKPDRSEFLRRQEEKIRQHEAVAREEKARTHRPDALISADGLRTRRPAATPIAPEPPKPGRFDAPQTFACCSYCSFNKRPDIAALPLGMLHLADHFYYSTVLMDQYPDVKRERLFGIVMGTQLGALVFSSWQKLLCSGSLFAALSGESSAFACPAAVAAALTTGTLPAMFERAVRALTATRAYGYPAQLVARGFAGVPWDLALQATLASARSEYAPPEWKPCWSPFTAAVARRAQVPSTPAGAASSVTGVSFIYGGNTFR